MAAQPSLRAPGIIVRALAIDRHAYEFLQKMASTTKSYGQFLLALVLAEYARRQERQQRLREAAPATREKQSSA